MGIKKMAEDILNRRGYSVTAIELNRAYHRNRKYKVGTGFHMAFYIVKYLILNEIAKPIYLPKGLPLENINTMKKKFNVMISGSRNFSDANKIQDLIEMAKLWLEHEKCDTVQNEDLKILHGGAKGADTLAEIYAQKVTIETEVFRPDYKKYRPKVAPIKRNQVMVSKADIVFCLYAGKQKSKGTLSVEKYAKKTKVELIVWWDGRWFSGEALKQSPTLF